ncbi:hypothetical protein [Streptomyces shenzhenensis]|uniref:hypothetical protein n=1 Tax=Streptomyces shenzhenensis TaxID=943815 RepID=UPI0036BA663C
MNMPFAHLTRRKAAAAAATAVAVGALLLGAPGAHAAPAPAAVGADSAYCQVYYIQYLAYLGAADRAEQNGDWYQALAHRLSAAGALATYQKCVG